VPSSKKSVKLAFRAGIDAYLFDCLISCVLSTGAPAEGLTGPHKQWKRIDGCGSTVKIWPPFTRSWSSSYTSQRPAAVHFAADGACSVTGATKEGRPEHILARAGGDLWIVGKTSGSARMYGVAGQPALIAERIKCRA